MLEGILFHQGVNENMLKKYQSLTLLLLVALFLTSCVPTVPEQPYIPVETIVAATYAAISAQTEAARPPNTPTPLPPTPTRRPGTATPTPTVTFVISSVTPTFTPTPTTEPTAANVTSGSGTVLYACNIISLTPQNVYQVKANETFTWTWQVENIGTTVWDPSTASVNFAGGTRLASQKNYPLIDRTKPGQTTTLTIKMHAPGQAGTYTSTWSLRKDIHTFCYAKLEIEVIK